MYRHRSSFLRIWGLYDIRYWRSGSIPTFRRNMLSPSSGMHTTLWKKVNPEEGSRMLLWNVSITTRLHGATTQKTINIYIYIYIYDNSVHKFNSQHIHIFFLVYLKTCSEL
jgi:hypothetical protein